MPPKKQQPSVLERAKRVVRKSVKQLSHAIQREPIAVVALAVGLASAFRPQ